MKAYSILLFTLFLNLSAIAQNGASLKISCDIEGATVKLNNVVKGITPLEIIVIPGTYTLIITKPISENQEYFHKETITIKNMEIKHITIKLEKQFTEAYKKKIASIQANIQYGNFTDNRDSKTYKTVKISTQTWMSENLAYKASSGCWAYDNDVKNVAKYGYLYDWETAKTVCPTGWHLPTDAEWTTLTTNLGGDDVAGGKLKSTTNWTSPNTGATNESGFTALPGGYCSRGGGSFSGVSNYGSWWTATEYDAPYVWGRDLDYSLATVSRGGNHKAFGFSVRCLKDN